MNAGNLTSSIWVSPHKPSRIEVIDQRLLPYRIEVLGLETAEDAWQAIREMAVRGAPLIGVTAAFGMYLASLRFSGKDYGEAMLQAADRLNGSRPTAVNLSYATRRMVSVIDITRDVTENTRRMFAEACRIREEEVESCRMIGEHGWGLIRDLWREKRSAVNILTHCNAGWLACVQWGTATAPIYLAHQKGIPLHVWVDETRPRNQGARLTAFELGLAGIPHTVIVDNAGGHLMQHGKVDLVVTGSDRTTANGDVANKIGTYLKALAAYDNHIPFYAALPSSTIDWDLEDGVATIPVEERDGEEVTHIEGWDGNEMRKVRVVPANGRVLNPGFDVTPARLVTGLITEKGICRADRVSLKTLFS